VAEQLLDRPQIGPAFEQVGREGVAEAVRMRKQPAERARVEAAAAGGEEERILCPASELRTAVAEVERQPVRGLLAERDDALLAALAVNMSNASSSLSTSRGRGASGSRRGLRGANEASGTRSGPSAWRRNARTAASLRPIVAGASLRGRPRPSSVA